MSKMKEKTDYLLFYAKICAHFLNYVSFSYIRLTPFVTASNIAIREVN